MTRKFIFADTSVLLNFICAGEQDLLLKFVGDEQLHVPQAVKYEVERKLKIPRFQRGLKTWNSLVTHGHVKVLADDYDRLWKHIYLFSGRGYTIQGGMAKNLGEYTAIAHCLALREDDPSVMTAIIIDDEEAKQLINKRQAATVFTTEAVLLRCVQLHLLTNRGESRRMWEKLSKFDNLLPFEQTKLNDRTYYRRFN
ncbi:MAG: hypothetical protein E6898_10060 [Corynebacterium sp.]|uniref:hypothetical protein n=1 Tax=unclassified Corynebacterium TaxID=2624378 RepID=UPI000A4F7E99|nr:MULTISPECIES: hypothetical protein [unclassified Corynebacterium]MBS5998467.1 hypothetical protein [Corynebacterium sp.]MDU1463063.1 hypothetical protein [Corynebacterium sp.]MDU7102615.1 hypothetical protein [Corynebacterium sp.]